MILNEQGPSYGQDLQAALEALARTSQASAHPDEPRSAAASLSCAETCSPTRIATCSGRSPGRAALEAGNARGAGRAAPARRAGRRASAARATRSAAGRHSSSRPPLEFFNGLGGFAKEGCEYVTILGAGQWTPAPWINVVSNRSFGFRSRSPARVHVGRQQRENR